MAPPCPRPSPGRTDAYSAVLIAELEGFELELEQGDIEEEGGETEEPSSATFAASARPPSAPAACQEENDVISWRVVSSPLSAGARARACPFHPTGVVFVDAHRKGPGSGCLRLGDLVDGVYLKLRLPATIPIKWIPGFTPQSSYLSSILYVFHDVGGDRGPGVARRGVGEKNPASQRGMGAGGRRW